MPELDALARETAAARRRAASDGLPPIERRRSFEDSPEVTRRSFADWRGPKAEPPPPDLRQRSPSRGGARRGRTSGDSLASLGSRGSQGSSDADRRRQSTPAPSRRSRSPSPARARRRSRARMSSFF